VKFLIIRFSSIGDIVLATPLVRCLKKKFPESRIDFVLKERYAGVLSGNPGISNLILYGGGIVPLIKKIRSEKYDYVLDIHGNFLSSLVSLFSGAKVLRSRRYLFERFMLVEFGLNFYRRNIPVSDRYIETASRLGVADDGLGPEFFVAGGVKNSLGVPPGIYAGICPVSVWKTKRWPQENFAELSKKIVAEKGCGVLIFGGPGDRDYCEKIRESAGGRAYNLSGLSIQETAFYLRMCRVAVTNDTGPMHIACALKIPVVAIFGPTVEEFGFYPQAAGSKVVSKGLPCKPCSTKGCAECPAGGFGCMKDISIEEVFSNCAGYL